MLYLCTYFERQLTPVCVDSAQAIWASFCFRFLAHAISGNLKELITGFSQWSCKRTVVATAVYVLRINNPGVTRYTASRVMERVSELVLRARVMERNQGGITETRRVKIG